MGFIDILKLKSVINRSKSVKKVFPDEKYVIDFAFEIGGIEYYQFNDIYNLPYERGLMSLAVYEETRMKCSREYLEKHVEALRTLLHEKKIDVFKINALNEQMSQRLNLALDTDLLYKLASIVYFDKNENPSLYEPEYCNKKIEHWRKHIGVHDFFLQKPLQELIPFLKNVDFDLNTYSQGMEQLNGIHLESLQLCTSKNT